MNRRQRTVEILRAIIHEIRTERITFMAGSVAYNAFARANRNVLAKLNSIAYDVYAFLATGIKSSPMRSDARATSERVIALAQTMGTAEASPAAHPGLAVR